MIVHIDPKWNQNSQSSDREVQKPSVQTRNLDSIYKSVLQITTFGAKQD